MEEDYRDTMAREDRLTELENELSVSKSRSDGVLCNAESEGMNIMFLYKEPCPECASENVNSFIEYGGTSVALVCKECRHRWRSA